MSPRRQLESAPSVLSSNVVRAANALAIVAFENGVLIGQDPVKTADELVGQTALLLAEARREALQDGDAKRSVVLYLAADALQADWAVPEIIALSRDMQNDALALHRGQITESPIVELY